MGSLDKRNEERQQEPEPISILILLKNIQREIHLLCTEMAEILGHPSSRYDLYPRLGSTLHLYWLAIEKGLLPRIENQEVRKALERDRAEEKEYLSDLDECPLQEDEIDNQEWRETFFQLKRLYHDHQRWSQERLFPELASLSNPELESLGRDFKKAMKALPCEEKKHETTV